MLGEQTSMFNYDEAQYLVIGVEDGWIKVDSIVWKQYLIAKRIVEEYNGNKDIRM